ncbi:hypothetical protein [Streptomyces sp. NPDC057280]|uniref:hypothetical protein n=1 Tax=Streptomyces sp. NPDC057280 TaxID=3346081 RepID=UPI00363DCF7C
MAIQRWDVEGVPAVGQVSGRGVPEPGAVGGNHDLSVHRAQPLHRVPGLQEGVRGEFLVRQADRLHLVGGEGSAVEDEPDLARAGRAGLKVGVVRGEGVDGEDGRQGQIQAQFLGDLVPTGEVGVLAGFDHAPGSSHDSSLR